LRALGWQPVVPLPESVSRVLTFWRQHPDKS
jgi:hypothetical protein